MESAGLGNQSANTNQLKWFMRIQRHVHEQWSRLWKGTWNRKEISEGSRADLFFSEAPERGSGSEMVLGNFAKTQTVEKQSMKVTVSFDVKDDQGSDFATITASYVGVPASGVAHMEGLLISGFLQPLVDVASAQAAPAA